MESQVHIDLVEIAKRYIALNIPAETISFIETDTAGSNSSIRLGGNIRPDVYYEYGGLLFIGEAKTENDFERLHSQNQFKSYFEECKYYQGQACLVVSVPWCIISTAKNYFRRMKNKNGFIFKIVVLDDNGKVFDI